MPSGSMEETIMLGDEFVVTETDRFERNDIVVFNYFGPDYSSFDAENPGKFKMVWSKRLYRLIAYSGDYLEIKNGEVFVNSKDVPIPPKAKLPYKILSNVLIDEFADKSEDEVQMTKSGDTIIYTTSISIEKAREFSQRKPAIISVIRVLPDITYEDSTIARASTKGNWTNVNYGPLKIPSSNDTIQVDNNNFNFYKNIPNIKMGKNIIKEKLYFVLGDNRYGAQDSRFIGLIAHSKMYGVVK